MKILYIMIALYVSASPLVPSDTIILWDYPENIEYCSIMIYHPEDQWPDDCDIEVTNRYIMEVQNLNY